MRIHVREFEENDFREITSWWEGRGELPPLPGMMMPNGTLVLELDGTPVLTITVLLTQTPELAYLEGYASRPGVEKELRNKLGALLFQHAYAYARSQGANRVLIYTNQEKLVSRYEELGMSRSPVSGLTALWKEL